LTRIEGKLPRDLNGSLFRVCPGQKETFGVRMKHLFDGDAFLSRYDFRGGQVFLKAKFLETPQRLEELQTKQMLYPNSELSDPAPPADYKYDGTWGKTSRRSM
jgi:carotenoid cleavage dioxygenase-like enzyme